MLGNCDININVEDLSTDSFIDARGTGTTGIAPFRTILPTGKCHVTGGSNKVEILSDQNHTPDAKEYLIITFRNADPNCKSWQLGRK